VDPQPAPARVSALELVMQAGEGKQQVRELVSPG
jgi:hypothetical protein